MNPLQQPDEILTAARRSLGLPLHTEGVGVELIAELLRRTAGLECPCSAATIKQRVLQALHGLADGETLAAMTDMALEELVAAGDLLELDKVTTVDERALGSWLFVAPPTFVQLSPESIRLIGMAPEETLPLADELRARVVQSGTRRILHPVPGEDVAEFLLAASFRQISLESWLRAPRPTSAKDHAKSLESRLAVSVRAGAIPGLRILAHRHPNYLSRWISPTSESGRFVARRPQAYGADLWCYVEIDRGAAQRLVDLPLPGSAWRGCDEGWLLQCAIDLEAGAPNTYSLRREADRAVLEVSFPLPMWAQRRLEAFGERVRPKAGVLAFVLSSQSAALVQEYLETELWMRPFGGDTKKGVIR